MINYYVDSCVYLNLWQKEKSKLGRPLWKFAKNFFEKVELGRIFDLLFWIFIKRIEFLF